jgi:hypothetical protein
MKTVGPCLANKQKRRGAAKNPGDQKQKRGCISDVNFLQWQKMVKN